jgi:hypothetical protein
MVVENQIRALRAHVKTIFEPLFLEVTNLITNDEYSPVEKNPAWLVE